MLWVSRSLLEGHVSVPKGFMGISGKDGVWVSQFGVLVPILWIPFVLLGRVLSQFHLPISPENCEEFAVSFYAPCMMTFALVILADIWAAAGCSLGRIRAGLWAVGIGTVLWPFAKLPGSDATTAVLLLLAFREHRLGASAKRLLSAGLWLGLMIPARKQSISIVPVVGMLWILQAWFTTRPDDRLKTTLRTTLLLGLGMVPGILLFLGYVWVRFGTLREPVYPGTEGLGLPSIATWASQASALIAGNRVGLVWYSGAITVATILGFRRVWQREPWTLAFVVAIAASQIAVLACLPFWHGGPSFGPRYLLAVILLAATLWGFLPQRLQPLQWWSLLLAGIAGFALNLPGVLTDPLPVYWRIETGNRNAWISSSYQESAVALHLQARPAWHSNHTEFTHPPFQVPDLWWCQLLRVVSAGGKPPTSGPPSPATETR
jgi:hypothetical protein